MSLKFVKMQAQGNDFIILDAITEHIPDLSQSLIQKMCHRHWGVGCDQLLIIKESEQADALLLIYNADGSLATNCGNGLRCVGDLLLTQLAKDEVSIALADRVVLLRRTTQGIRVNMGKSMVEKVTKDYIDVDMGNPHRVYFKDAVACPERNVEIISSFDAQHAHICIIERGTGETLACGSGACATAVAIWQQEKHQQPLHIHMPGGVVMVSQHHHDIYLEGHVTTVCCGVYLDQIDKQGV